MTFETLPPEAVRDLVAHGATLVDIRSPAEWAREHIAGARNLPLEQFAARQVHLQGSQTVVFHCGSGVRTTDNAPLLYAACQNARVCIMDGGINRWKQVGLPVQSGAP